MPIPALNEDGFLPDGVHDCSLVELRERFGQFHQSDRRCQLFDRFADYLREAQTSGVVRAVIVDGSFVTAKAIPNDVDLIVISLAKAALPSILRPMEYNALSRRHIRRTYGMDVLLAQEGESEVEEHIEFFSLVRNRPETRKGMLRIAI